MPVITIEIDSTLIKQFDLIAKKRNRTRTGELRELMQREILISRQEDSKPCCEVVAEAQQQEA